MLTNDKSQDIQNAANLILEIAAAHFSHPSKVARIHAAYMSVEAVLFKIMQAINAETE